MRLLYTFFIRVYTLLITVLAVFNDKARLWRNGRKNWKTRLNSKDFGKHDVYWFHCASLGEFEQGRPLMEQLKLNQKNKIILTFFSPSGYELRKNYSGADWIFYLPEDTVENAQFYIKTINPKAAFFIKYEFWFNYLYELKKQDIPVFLVSGIFRDNQYFFKWYGKWASKQLLAFTYFFVQNRQSQNLLEQIGHKNVIVSGDTRFDRVLKIKSEKKRFPLIETFTNNAFVIVAGSTYKEDEKVLSLAFKKLQKLYPHIKLIIAPHVVTKNRIQEIENLFGTTQCIRFSEFNENNASQSVLLIDNIGMLSSLYAYASIAYIGGGLGNGIHNTLEAAVYGIPTLFGNNYQKFEEATALVNLNASIVIHNENELLEQIETLFKNQDLRINIGKNAANYVMQQSGAIDKIMVQLKLYDIH